MQTQLNEKGWTELLRFYADASKLTETSQPSWSLIWLYVPDYMHNGTMTSVKYIPKHNYTFDEVDAKTVNGTIPADMVYWQ
jgi:hypothetical protein